MGIPSPRCGWWNDNFTLNRWKHPEIPSNGQTRIGVLQLATITHLAESNPAGREAGLDHDHHDSRLIPGAASWNEKDLLQNEAAWFIRKGIRTALHEPGHPHADCPNPACTVFLPHFEVLWPFGAVDDRHALRRRHSGIGNVRRAKPLGDTFDSSRVWFMEANAAVYPNGLDVSSVSKHCVSMGCLNDRVHTWCVGIYLRTL